MNECPACGAAVGPEDLSCPTCGARIEGATLKFAPVSAPEVQSGAPVSSA